MRDAIARGLDHARQRTLTLNEFDDAELVRQHHELMSPLVWDLAHVGQQEDLWLLRGGNAQRDGVLPAEVDRLYDAFRSSRADRAGMPLLSPVEARRFIAEVRARAFDQLDRADDLFPYAMVEQHEQQHVETMYRHPSTARRAPSARARQHATATARGAARCRTGPGRRVRPGCRRLV